MSNRFTERAQRVILAAQEEAKRWPYQTVEPLHLLLALRGLEQGTGCQILTNRGVGYESIKEWGLQHLQPSASAPPLGDIAFSVPAKRVLELAVEEAQQLGHHFVGTEHLLLALCRSESLAELLTNRKLTPKDVRRSVVETVGRGPAHLQETTPAWSGSERSQRMDLLGPQLMVIAISPGVEGVLITGDPEAKQIEPALIILLEDGADLDKTFESLRSVLPPVNRICFKQLGKKPVSWSQGRWEEHDDAPEELKF